MKKALNIAVLIMMALFAVLVMARPSKTAVQANGMEGEKSMQKATLAAGCFWGVEATFQHIPGVISTRVGYTGGHLKDPTYKQVCRGDSGHAEAVEITYDPDIVSYRQLLDLFWKNHNPTTRDRQGPDIGSQYRSAIFYHTPEQQNIAEQSRQAWNTSGAYRRPIVTEIVPASPFYPAEEYHQQYLEKRGFSVCH